MCGPVQLGFSRGGNLSDLTDIKSNSQELSQSNVRAIWDSRPLLECVYFNRTPIVAEDKSSLLNLTELVILKKTIMNFHLKASIVQ